jgi:hypothetical protein
MFIIIVIIIDLNYIQEKILVLRPGYICFKEYHLLRYDAV